MSNRKISRKDLLSACADPGPGDGLDPRLDGGGGPGPVPNRKALQLCGQVARTLASVLAESGDEVLRNLLVESVVPAPNSSRLLVTVSVAIGGGGEETERVAEHLGRARGRLRGEVASAVHRRRVPDLTFRVVGPTSGALPRAAPSGPTG